MYFWKIEKLKSEIRSGPLPDAHVWKYLLAYTIVMALILEMITLEKFSQFTPEPVAAGLWDYLASIALIVVAVGGVVYCYRCNGGASGERFIEKYFALGWVVCIRVLVMLMPAFVIVYAVIETSDDVTSNLSSVDVALIVVTGAILCWRLGTHLADTAGEQAENAPSV